VVIADSGKSDWDDLFDDVESEWHRCTGDGMSRLKVKELPTYPVLRAEESEPNEMPIWWLIGGILKVGTGWMYMGLAADG